MKRVCAERQPILSWVCWQCKRWPQTGPACRRALRFFALMALTTVAGACLAERAGAQQKPVPKPRLGFDKPTVTAWKKKGAHVGWTSNDILGFLQLRDSHPEESVPAFRFALWYPQLLAGLPDPAVPFGLYFGGTQMSDAGLKELAAFKKLQTLNIWNTKVTDAGLKELAALKRLQELNLAGTLVTDAGLKELASIKSLQALNLPARVTDMGLKELAALKSLQTLRFESTRVTDAGLKELAGLKSLQTLVLLGTGVTAKGVAELQKALPACRILREGSTVGVR